MRFGIVINPISGRRGRDRDEGARRLALARRLAAAGHSFNRRRIRGPRGYGAQAFRSVWSYQPRLYRVRLDDQTFDGRCFVVAFANGRQYGNGLTLSAGADPQDGWLDAVIVEGG